MFLYSSWLKTPLHIRHKIAAEFGIYKKGSIHVVDNHVQNDGYLVSDIEENLTIQTLQNYLETEEKDPATLWNMFVQEVENPRIKEAPVSVPIEILSEVEITSVKEEVKDVKTKKTK
jgi:hypothetical protein